MAGGKGGGKAGGGMAGGDDGVGTVAGLAAARKRHRGGVMRKVRWGILSTARIGTEKVIPAMQQGEHTEVVAIASRDAEVARAAAGRLGIPRAYGSYEELLADPEVDAVYNPLPNHLHVPWTLRAMEAGKHVLCEKPIALSAAEAELLLTAARERPAVKVMEAFMYRHHPQWRRVRQLIAEGGIGELRTVHATFSYFNDDPSDIRNMADIGGGGLMDVGCYTISVARFLFGSEPARVSGMVEYDPAFATDRLASGILEFGSGTATFTCSTQLAPHQTVQIAGTTGRLELEIPFTPAPDQPCTIRHQHAGGREEIVVEPASQYTLQGDLFSLAVLEDGPVFTPLEDAVANMRVIEAVFESGRLGCVVEPR
jgi:predicted dehydrogenase